LTSLNIVKDTFVSSKAYLATLTTGGGTHITVTNTNIDTTAAPFIDKTIANDAGTARYVTPSYTGCSGGAAYTCSSIRYPSNNTAFTYASTNFNLGNEVGATSKVKFTTTTDSSVNEFVGSRTVELVCANTESDTIEPYIRYNIVPAADNPHVSAVTTSSNCQTPVFPIFYGNDNDVELNYIGGALGTDSDENLIIAGQGA
jgi:hypothetical protein